MKMSDIAKRMGRSCAAISAINREMNIRQYSGRSFVLVGLLLVLLAGCGQPKRAKLGFPVERQTYVYVWNEDSRSYFVGIRKSNMPALKEAMKDIGCGSKRIGPCVIRPIDIDMFEVIPHPPER